MESVGYHHPLKTLHRERIVHVPASRTGCDALTETTGPTPDEVLERVQAGETNEATERTSRTISEIVRANVFTRFNGILWVRVYLAV
jgi:hypothetical protein